MLNLLRAGAGSLNFIYLEYFMFLAGVRLIRGFLLLLLLIVQSVPAMAMDAQQVIEKAISDVMVVLDEEASVGTDISEETYSLVEARVLPYFDFDRMSHLILGNSWKDATGDQKTRFQFGFKRLLINTYASALSEYASNDKEIVYLPTITSSNPDVVIVPTEIRQQGGQPISVAYRMFRQDETWHIYDVAIGGISLVMNYRASFASQIREGGIEGLLSSLSSHSK